MAAGNSADRPEAHMDLEDRLSESQNAALVDPLDPEAGEIRPIDNEAADLRITGQLRAQGVKIGRGFITPRVFWPSLIITAVSYTHLTLPTSDLV